MSESAPDTLFGGAEKRNRFGRVFEFKSTVFDRFETTTHPRYAPQKLDSRVALLDARPPLPPRPHAHAALFSAACGLQWRARRIAEGLGRTFHPVFRAQLAKRSWGSARSLLRSWESLMGGAELGDWGISQAPPRAEH